MPDVEAVSVAALSNGAIAGSVKNDTEATGAGAWQSVHLKEYGWVWKPALIAKTIQMNNPSKDSIHRIVDVIVRDAQNKPVMHPDPAAAAYVREHWKGQDVKHDWIPVMAFNEAKEPIRESVSELKEIMVEQSRKQTEAFTNLTNVLAAVLSGKAPTPVAEPATVAPKRRGRPPKAKES